ncbi:ubiquinone/menaquinone biosynthesis C-methylase UbiE [Dyadobacter jejuensis]|uniref:Ubiquinone/menaquinone biosynthesis C-methylase UbiE n=1 Tax=Dyadobacter jejuensis TaxID=1082580 RepID=A0A316AP37_9BACT|nr:class I SAM-dependent methyltransferase [Dyadobacter jejuensis]PWJ59463.1 ubiquinone/menaquinone biosynthesis C-methylase UbiE [Dyadobacter jejuensis]
MAWYHTYFNGLPQRAWKLHQDEDFDLLEADFLWDVLELEAGNRVLDVLSGYGRHALPLAKDGCELTCIDISKEYCDELEKARLTKNLPIEVICGDVLDCTLPVDTFDAAYCFGNSFSFFPRQDLKKMIGLVSRSLKSGGCFSIHTQNLAESVFTDFQTRNWMPVGNGITYLTENEYNAQEGCIEAEQTFLSGDEKVTHRVRQYIFTLAELCALFEDSGFKILGAYSSIEADQYLLGDEALYLVARKL